MPQDSIGAGWLDMAKRSEYPTGAERARLDELRRQGLPEVRHKVSVRYERIFGIWRVTLSDGGGMLRECRFEHGHTLQEMIRRGRGFGCLADRQAVESGIRQGRGAIDLHLDADQYAALASPQ